MFRDLVLPGYLKALTELNQFGVHYAFRSVGNLWPLMDMLFVEAACPGYGETDRDATMTVGAVRARFPRLVIWGNALSPLLAQDTVTQVRTEAQAALREANGRGYFQGCSNAIVQGTPLENVRALGEVRKNQRKRRSRVPNSQIQEKQTPIAIWSEHRLGQYGVHSP